MADWYYAKDGQQFGPVSAAQLKQLATAGKLQPEDLVFQEGGKEWVPASSVKGLFAGATSTRSAPARSDGGSGGSFAFDEKPAPPGRDDDDDRDIRTPRRGSQGGGGVMDLLMFRRMIAPWIIIVLFWLGIASIVLGGLGAAVFMMVNKQVLMGLGVLVAIPFWLLGWRLYCELLILLFRMNESLSDIKDELAKQRKS